MSVLDYMEACVNVEDVCKYSIAASLQGTIYLAIHGCDFN